MLQYGEVNLRRVVPLAVGLLHLSNPKPQVSRAIHSLASAFETAAWSTASRAHTMMREADGHTFISCCGTHFFLCYLVATLRCTQV